MNPCVGHQCDNCAICRGEKCCGFRRGARLGRRRILQDVGVAAAVNADTPWRPMTFLLSDVEGSTALWEQEPWAMSSALERHDLIFDEVVQAHGGRHIRPRGEGDSRFAVFDGAPAAVAAALTIQRVFVAEVWPTTRPIMVRIGIHTGEALLRDGDYYGTDVNRCARLRSLARGGQILLSEATTRHVRGLLPAGAHLRDLGEQQLRGLIQPERIAQLLHPELSGELPPLAVLTERAELQPVG